jgi:hypothetical protein
MDLFVELANELRLQPVYVDQGSAGADACADCLAGQYQGASTASACANCPAGTYQATPGASACNSCAGGTHTPLAGASSSAARLTTRA